MADISKIKLPNGNEYNLKDATARAQGKVSGVKGNAESSYRTGNVNLTPANIGALPISGGTLTNADNVFFTVNDNTIVQAYPKSIIQSPIPKFLWHDLFAFNRSRVPTYYKTTDGVEWTQAPLDKRVFINKEAWGKVKLVSDLDSTYGSRYVWLDANFYASSGCWLVLGIMYAYPISHFDLLLETSSDNGSTWTTLISVNNIYYSQKPIWIYNSKTVQDSLRLTITRNSNSAQGSYLPICSIKFLTYRWGDQGKGSEYEYPYQWDEEFDIYPIYNNSSSLGTSTYNWKNVYSTNGTFTNINGVAVGSSPKFTDTTYTAATAAPGKVASASAQGSSTNYARQDHTHGIDLATGDSNGQVKIAGTNVSVKGLGVLAYKDSITSSDVTTALGYTPPQQDTTYSIATTTSDGLMSSSDKTKLDHIASSYNSTTETLIITL